MIENAQTAVPTQPPSGDVAIVGFGTAAVNAAIALRSAGFTGCVRVFSDTAILPYSPILTSYFAGGTRAFEECLPWTQAEIADLDLTVMHSCPVEEIDPQAHVLHTARGDFAYAKCLIATGATPRTAGFVGVEGEPGFKPLVLRTMDDAQRLRAVLEDPSCRRVLVSGASMVALKILEACLAQGKQAVLVGRKPHLLGLGAHKQAAERFERAVRAQGAELRLSQTVQSVHRISADEDPANAGRLKAVFSNGEEDVLDHIAVAHGMDANRSFIPEGALAMGEGIDVDELMRTSVADVYAAGDVAQVFDLVSGEKRIIGLWKAAALQGSCAGRAMAAELAGGTPDAADACAGFIASNTISVGSALFISAGSVELLAGRSVEVREGDDMTVVTVYEDDAPGGRRLVGFNLASDAGEEGGVAYDTGAMLTMRVEAACRRR